jgi:hypothetical protein
MLKYYDNDYLRDDQYIYGVKGNWDESENEILVKPVYQYDNSWKKIVDLKGQFGENFTWVNPLEYTHVSSRGIGDEILMRQDLWGDFAHELLSIGIPKEDIGYFGSFRLGFNNYKDIDFIVYGRHSLKILKNYIHEFKRNLSLYNITEQHITYQANSHGKHYSIGPEQLKHALRKKWTSCMIEEGICSTIRFVDSERETGRLLTQIFEIEGTDVMVTGIVKDADSTSYYPRQFTLQTNTEQVNVIVPLWIYHQCVRDGDYIHVLGIKNGNQLIVRDYTHGIEFI